MADPQSIRENIAIALGLDIQDVNLCPDEEIARVESKTIRQFDFPENSDYFICFEKCIFEINISILRATSLILHFRETHFQAINISYAKIQELQIESSRIHGSVLITGRNHFDNIVLQGCTFCNRFEIDSTRISDSFFVTENDFKNAPFVLSDSYFKGACILRENTFYGVEARLCTFESNLDFSLSELYTPLIFIGNKILDEQLAVFHFVKTFFCFDALENWIRQADKKIEILPNPMPSSQLIKSSTPILYTNNPTNQYFLKSNSDPKALLQTYQETTISVKKILNNNGSIIEASSWNTQSLYCKEIELDFKPQKSLRDWIDWLQLLFYRHTSDHHTDLPKIISWVIVTIGVFGFLWFALKVCQDPIILKQLNSYGVTLSIAGAVGIGALWCFTKEKVFSYLCAIPTLWIICYKPKLIFGVLNLIDDKPRSGWENLLLVLYTLVMILLLFSLQKTARKNSIVPS